MNAAPATHFAESLQAVVVRSALVRRLHVHDEVASTNDEALALLRDGAPHGTLVVADRQTAGRGRLGRSWDSPAGTGLWLSFVLRPDLPIERAFLLTAAAAVALVDTTARMTGRSATIRWPNDVLCGPRKLAGILAEARGSAGGSAIVLGVGLNVNQTSAQFPEVLRPVATSLAIEAGRPVDRILTFAAFLEAFELALGGIGRDQGRLLLDTWRGAMPLNGEPVSVTLPESVITGILRGVDDDGALRLESNGTIRRLSSGDVRRMRGEGEEG